jgi:hypothetical protein
MLVALSPRIPQDLKLGSLRAGLNLLGKEKSLPNQGIEVGFLGPPFRSEVTTLTELSEYYIEICVLLTISSISDILLRYSISIFTAHNASVPV